MTAPGKVTRGELEALVDLYAVLYRRKPDASYALALRVFRALLAALDEPASDGELFSALRAGNCTLIEAFRAGERHALSRIVADAQGGREEV